MSIFHLAIDVRMINEELTRVAGDTAPYELKRLGSCCGLDDMLGLAQQYLHAGLCILPANRQQKRPALKNWKPYQQRLPTTEEVATWFASPRPLCVLTGEVSGNLEMIDFDHQAELFSVWRDLVDSESPGLVDRLVIESSQSGGRHVVFRGPCLPPGNQKLAQRSIDAPSKAPILVGGKEYVPRRVGSAYAVTITLIETRGEGGLFLCAPTAGYEIEQGTFDEIPVLSEDERAILMEAAKALNEVIPGPEPIRTISQATGRPGDEFNESGDVAQVLLSHGWKRVKDGPTEYWRRPGKSVGWSATLRNRVFYVFSSNATPFEPERSYSPFGVYALLEHDGDFRAAAAALRKDGFGRALPRESSRVSSPLPVKRSSPSYGFHDPGPLPSRLIRVPGFVSEVMDHTLTTAPYPNEAMAFCGALALQSMLAGRKVRDSADNRTNLYILALANASVGKDWPRKVNACIVSRVGLIAALGDEFASAEGIQDSLWSTPTMLYQTDEMDTLLHSIRKSRDARYERISATLLKLYSAANSVYPMRRKAGREGPEFIDQPCLVILGTAIPSHYYGALSERMLTNGLLARMLIIESGPRGAGQEPGIIRPSSRVIQQAKWWAKRKPAVGRQGSLAPAIVNADQEAQRLLDEARLMSELEYSFAEKNGDAMGAAVWGRFPEHVRKLSLLFAVSANHRKPMIDAAAVRWATELVTHQTRRMLFMVKSHAAESPFDEACLKLLHKLRQAPEQQLTHSVLLKRMKLDARSFQELVHTLEQRGDIRTIMVSTQGRPQTLYQLLDTE